MSYSDEQFMQRCLQLAALGEYYVAPNPMVGAVIVSADGRIIGEGWHRRYGGPHAEVNAFASVKSEDEPLLSEATIYVSLEPCSHFGKTPPCADLIVRKGVKRVVIACLDPNPLVAGNGVRKLREAGIEVESGIMENEARQLDEGGKYGYSRGGKHYHKRQSTTAYHSLAGQKSASYSVRQ